MIEQFVRAVLTALWAIAPAYLPNSAAVVVGGGRPIDGGRTWRDNRVLGDGKTWRGFLGGTLSVALPAWTLATFSAPVVVTLLVVTPLLHRGTNWIAYRLGLEDEPW